MQWDAGPNAGFTGGRPWLPIGAQHTVVNVERERSDPRSMLSLYRRLLELRRSERALNFGSYRSVAAPDGVLSFIREAEGRRFLIALNLTSEERVIELGVLTGRTVLSSFLDDVFAPISGILRLRADEAVVAQVE